MDAYQEICAKNSAYDIKRIDDPAFKQYGTLWNEFDLTELEAFCNKNVKIDSEKNFYVPSNPALEKLTLIQQVSNEVYAGMPLEAGECTGQTRDFTAVVSSGKRSQRCLDGRRDGFGSSSNFGRKRINRPERRCKAVLRSCRHRI